MRRVDLGDGDTFGAAYALGLQVALRGWVDPKPVKRLTAAGLPSDVDHVDALEDGWHEGMLRTGSDLT